MKRSYFIALAMLFIAALGGCDESGPANPTETHFEPVGISLYRNGSQAFKYFNNKIDTTLSKEILSDNSSSSQEWEIRFYNSDGSEVYIEDQYGEYGDYEFDWTIADPSVAQLTTYERIADRRPNFRLVGLKPGLTTIEFKIKHQGHEDFRTAKLPLRSY